MFSNKDYIMRIIQQFVQALMAIILARKAGKHDEAFVLIQSAGKMYLDADIATLVTYTPDELLDYFRKKDRSIDAERCLICAELIHEIALISDATQNKTASLRLKQLCLHLYVHTLAQDPQLATQDILAKMNSCKENLQ